MVSDLGSAVSSFPLVPVSVRRSHRTSNSVAIVDRPHYHLPAPLLLTADLVFFHQEEELVAGEQE